MDYNINIKYPLWIIQEMKAMTNESKEFINLIRQLNFEELKKFYYMIKGAIVVANNRNEYSDTE